MYHLRLSQGTPAQTLWHPAATPDSRTTLEFHFYGFHRETSGVFRIYNHSRCCRSTYEADHIHSNTRYDHFPSTHRTVRTPCLFQTRSPFPHYIRSWFRVRLPFLLISRESP